jgi:hypothetical protein
MYAGVWLYSNTFYDYNEQSVTVYIRGVLMPQEIEIDRFIAKTDFGRPYIIIVYQEYIPAGTYDNPYGTAEGRRRYTTSTGLHVYSVAGGMYYKVVETDELLRKT